MNANVTAVSPTDRFFFRCAETVPCFNACCRDLNQLLTPYDILRIKHNLGMTSAAFLERYCAGHAGPQSGLPVVSLKPADPDELTCPFVTSSGCAVYPDRPSSCRMYPLARMVSRSRETGETIEQYMVLRESHCLGFEQKESQTVAEWIVRQDLLPYNRHNDRLMEIIRLKNQRGPGPLGPADGRLFYLACYDLDAFRTRVFEGNILKDVEIDPNILAQSEESDEALLTVGMETVKQRLFGKRC